MKKPTIIISSYDDLKNPYFAGGGAQAVHQLAKRLVKDAYQVTGITGRYPGSKNEIVDGVIYKRIGTSFLGAQLDQLTFQVCLPFHVMTKKFDVWMESFTPPFSTNFLQLFTRKPVIGLVHMLSGEDMKRKYKLPFDAIERFGLRTYKQIVVTSEFMKEKIQPCTNGRIAIIPNGLEKIPSAPKGKGKYILFLGRIEVDQKGIDLLLHAYTKIANTITYPLYIAGSGEPKEEAKLQQLVTSLSLEKKVTLLGKVTGTAKEQLYLEALFVVIPARFETFSIVALESLAHGKAVMHFPIDGLRWIPDNCGITVDSLDVDKLAEAIQQATAHPESLAKLGMNGQAYTKRFTWDSITSQYEELIQMLLQNTNQ